MFVARPRRERGRAGACRSSAAPASCWTSCWGRSEWSVLMCLWQMSLSADLPATAIRCRSRSRTARTTSCVRVELIQPTVICTLRQLLDQSSCAATHGITRLHGQPEAITLGRRRCGSIDLHPPRACTRRGCSDPARGLLALPQLIASGAPEQPSSRSLQRCPSPPMCGSGRSPGAEQERQRRSAEADQLGFVLDAPTMF